MNCYTGEITDRAELIREWKEQGIPVLHLGRFEDLHATAEAADEVHHRETGLLDAIGAKIVDAEAEAREASDRKAREFAAKIHARR